MAFKSHTLSVLAYSNGFTLWHYETEDGAAAVEMQGYFQEAKDMLRSGDMLMVNTGDEEAGTYLVSKSEDSVIPMLKTRQKSNPLTQDQRNRDQCPIHQNMF